LIIRANYKALGLQVQHVHLNDLDGGYLRIVGKGNKERVIPLIDASRSVALLRNVLKTLGGVGPLFRGDVRKGGRHGEALDYSTVIDLETIKRELVEARQRKR
jgi:hypothetical protein